MQENDRAALSFFKIVFRATSSVEIKIYSNQI